MSNGLTDIEKQAHLLDQEFVKEHLILGIQICTMHNNLGQVETLILVI